MQLSMPPHLDDHLPALLDMVELPVVLQTFFCLNKTVFFCLNISAILYFVTIVTKKTFDTIFKKGILFDI
jgi:hypothetical protein